MYDGGRHLHFLLRLRVSWVDHVCVYPLRSSYSMSLCVVVVMVVEVVSVMVVVRRRPVLPGLVEVVAVVLEVKGMECGHVGEAPHALG